MKQVKGFIRFVADSSYDVEEHDFIDTEEVVLNVNEISEIIDYMPDDPDYNMNNVGIKIIMTNGNEYINMGWTIDEMMSRIEDAM